MSSNFYTNASIRVTTPQIPSLVHQIDDNSSAKSIIRVSKPRTPSREAKISELQPTTPLSSPTINTPSSPLKFSSSWPTPLIKRWHGRTKEAGGRLYLISLVLLRSALSLFVEDIRSAHASFSVYDILCKQTKMNQNLTIKLMKNW